MPSIIDTASDAADQAEIRAMEIADATWNQPTSENPTRGQTEDSKVHWTSLDGA